jgi:hypothetical protein
MSQGDRTDDGVSQQGFAAGAAMLAVFALVGAGVGAGAAQADVGYYISQEFGIEGSAGAFTGWMVGGMGGSAGTWVGQQVGAAVGSGFGPAGAMIGGWIGSSIGGA